MNRMILLAGIAALGLTACGKAPEPTNSATAEPAAPAVNATNATPTANQTASADAAPAAVAQCQACHTLTAGGANGVGPNLHGVVGRKAGAAAGFTYSDAMKASGITWDETKLDEYLTNPAKLVPGNKMPFAGIADAAQRKEVVSYLATLK